MSLREVDIADPATVVSNETVTLLEKVLDMAKRGELQEVVLAGVLDNRDSYFGFTGTLRARERVALLEYAKWQWMRDWMGETE